MKTPKIYISSLCGNYKKKCSSHNEAIILQNDSNSLYHLGLIEWE